MTLSLAQVGEFQSKIQKYYENHGRVMPWRTQHDFYSVLVSEYMLQQTQVSRVIPQFEKFVNRYPTIHHLASAPLADVIIAWQGLGYNRRAKYLHDTAKIIDTNGLPENYDALLRLPGIGPNTAGAICVYALNQPAVYIETNIRTVFIYEFFATDPKVDDKAILALVQQTVDTNNPRTWYWALMDYGAYLKSQGQGSIRRSQQYKRQSPFQGSLRQVRGAILRELSSGPRTIDQLRAIHDDRFDQAYIGLASDGLITTHGEQVCLTAYTQES